MDRRYLVFCCVAALCSLLGAAAGNAQYASSRTVTDDMWPFPFRTYPNVMVYSTVKKWLPGGILHCGVVTFDEFDDIPGASAYRSYVYDGGRLVYHQWDEGGTWYDDAVNYVDWHYAPTGRHRFFDSGAAGQGPGPDCGRPDTWRFEAAGVNVYFSGKPPLARFSFSYDQNDPPRVLFDGSASKGNIVSYDWDFGDGQTGTGVQTTHRYSALGTYNVKLTVTDDQGLGDVVRHDVRNDKLLLVYTPVAAPNTVNTGDSFVLNIEVKNTGSKTLTGVIPTAPPSAVSKDGADVQMTRGPQPSGPLTLAPGELRTFAYDYQANAAGSAVFTAVVEGSDSISTMTAKSTCVAADPGCGRVTVTDQTIVVNSIEWKYLSPGATTCDTGAVITRNGQPEPECTLRAAIELANGRAGRDFIVFDIPNVSGMPEIQHTILQVTDGVVIDGSTQPGARRIGLLGREGNAIASDLRIACENPTPDLALKPYGPGIVLDAGSSGSEIRGLAVYGFDTAGILTMPGSSGNVIANNLVGTDGRAPRGNGASCTTKNFGAPGLMYLGGGVVVASSGNTITGNFFRGNGSLVPWQHHTESYAIGVGLHLLSGGDGNVVQGNTFQGGDGPSPAFRGKQDVNILIEDAAGNLIGGPGPGEGNTIEDGDRQNVIIYGASATGNLVQGNAIGINGLEHRGVSIQSGATGNTVGGYAPGEGNLVSWVSLEGADTNRVIGNFIGVNTAGGDLPGWNADVAVWVTKSNASVIVANLIGHTRMYGIVVDDGNNSVILKNRIFKNGLQLRADEAAGILVRGGTGNTIRANSIFANRGLGIDLGRDFAPDGPDGLGDVGDGDTGPNERQNTAIITSVVRSGPTTIVSGTVRTPLTSSAAYIVDIYENNSCDSSGWGEGQTYLGSVETTAAAGSANFSLTVSDSRSGWFSATATDTAGNTSEFSKCRASTTGSIVMRPGLNGASVEVFDVGGFSVGDQVRLCPGCANEELGQVTLIRPSSQNTAGASLTYLGTRGTLYFARAFANSHFYPEPVAVEPVPNPAACADPAGDGVKASDALYVLKVALGLIDDDDCIADVNGDGAQSATDALLALRIAVGLSDEPLCPICL